MISIGYNRNKLLKIGLTNNPESYKILKSIAIKVNSENCRRQWGNLEKCLHKLFSHQEINYIINIISGIIIFIITRNYSSGGIRFYNGYWIRYFCFTSQKI